MIRHVQVQCLSRGVAMLFALAAAPLVHIHERDHHGAALVHVHFFEPESPLSNSGHSLETPDSHGHVTWVDVFTLNAPVTTIIHAVAEFSEPLPLPLPAPSQARLEVQTLRAHSPPEFSQLPPRSPPAV